VVELLQQSASTPFSRTIRGHTSGYTSSDSPFPTAPARDQAVQGEGGEGEGGLLRHSCIQRSALRAVVYEVTLVLDKHELGAKVTQPASRVVVQVLAQENAVDSIFNASVSFDVPTKARRPHRPKGPSSAH